MTVSNFINWRGMKIPKITHGARIDILASDIPYYGQFVYEDGIRIAFPPGLIAYSQIVLDDHYEAYPVNPEGRVLFEGFEPVVIVAHDPPQDYSIGPVHISCRCEPPPITPDWDGEDYEPDISDYYPEPDDPDYC